MRLPSYGLFLVGLILLMVFASVKSLETQKEEIDDLLAREAGFESSFAQTLTRDFLFFVTFLGHVVLFLVFFWEKPTMTRRWHVGEEAAEEQSRQQDLISEIAQEPQPLVPPLIHPDPLMPLDPVEHVALVSNPVDVPKESSDTHKEAGSEENAPKSPASDIEEQFAPLEATIHDLQHRIASLERTIARRKGRYPTDSLKSRLRECISTIAGTMAQLDDKSNPVDAPKPAEDDPSIHSSKFDITKWDLESIQTSKRSLELQLEQFESSQTTNQSPQVQTLAVVMQDAPTSLNMSTPTKEYSPQDEKTSTNESQTTPIEAAPPKHSNPDLLKEFNLDDQDLDFLEAQLGGKKGRKGGKGGKVKISGKALSLFAPFEDKESTSLSQQSSVDTGVSAEDHESASNKNIDEPTRDQEIDEPNPPKIDDFGSLKDLVDTLEAPNHQQQEVLPDKTEGTDSPSKPLESPAKEKVSPRVESPKKKEADTTPVNIFNMFGPLPTIEPTQTFDESSSSSENESASGESTDDDSKDLKLSTHDDVKDLLAGLGDFSMPLDLNVGGPLATSDNDLMAALNSFSMPKDNSDDETSDSGRNSSDSEDENGSENSDTKEGEEDDFDAILARERPAISSFSVSAATNESGLRRAKKTVSLGKGKKGGYQMEDFNFCAFPWINDNWGLFCVMDGHSGAGCAEAAKSLIPKYLQQNLEGIDLSKDGGVDLKEQLIKTFLDADQDLKQFEYEGATCTVVFIYKTSSGKRYVQTANVGDSAATLIRKKHAIELTQDHHPNYPHEVERLRSLGIELNEGQTRLNGLAVSRALGDHFPKEEKCGIVAEPYVSPLTELTDNDSFIIVASDGLWDVIHYQKAYEIIQNLGTSAEMSKSLLRTATSSSKCTDNVTTIVVQL